MLAEVGSAVVWLALLAAAVVACTALASVSLAREVYLGIAFFHAYLELLAGALLWVRPKEAGAQGRSG